MQNKLLIKIIIALFCILICNATANQGICYQNNLDKRNTIAHAYIVKGIAAYKLGNYEESIKCYDNAIALKPTKEIEEAGWAGKELAFYKQGKNNDVLCCYLKLKSIDRNTNLIEKSKSKLLISAPGSLRASLFGGFIDTEALLFALEDAGAYVMEEGLATGNAPAIIIGAVCVIGALAYENREEIKSYIENAFYDTNNSQININNTRTVFLGSRI